MKEIKSLLNRIRDSLDEAFRLPFREFPEGCEPEPDYFYSGTILVDRQTTNLSMLTEVNGVKLSGRTPFEIQNPLIAHAEERGSRKVYLRVTAVTPIIIPRGPGGYISYIKKTVFLDIDKTVSDPNGSFVKINRNEAGHIVDTKTGMVIPDDEIGVVTPKTTDKKK